MQQIIKELFRELEDAGLNRYGISITIGKYLKLKEKWEDWAKNEDFWGDER